MSGDCIPYKGSKRKLAKRIVRKILSDNPNTKYFYDLFGGGGAISFEALQQSSLKKVLYNEIDGSIVNLIKHLQEKGITNDFYQWVSREDFFKIIEKDDYLSGLVKTCWSFGNNGRDYLYSKDNEILKKPLHEICVNKSQKAINEFKSLSGIDIPKDLMYNSNEDLFGDDTIQERRLRIMGFVKKSIGRIDLQHLESIQQIERIDLEPLERLQNLEQLQHLLQIQNIQNLEKLELSNESYDAVRIDTPIEETIIYLDPPYKDTNKYNYSMDHDKLYDWIKNSKYKIYLSSYDYDLPCVLELEHRSVLGTSSNKEVKEKLFYWKGREY